MPPDAVTEARRYTIIGVLGRGGFGKVYLARLEGAQGFVKYVALKLLSEDQPPPDVLGRFRDEARILGRLRDRNIVGVDPPVELDGRWAVVMEYVEGRTCQHLLGTYEKLPLRVAVGIVEEVARTLDNLWNHRDEHGESLQLLHRDLKPPNIQITPTGGVKLLDFGVARARIVRETHTSTHISGTIGYIAPERIEGVEHHKGDVYSLGIVLEELILGQHPLLVEDEQVSEDPALSRVLALAREMRQRDPPARPDAAEVERRCGELLLQLPGATLREWAREHVEPLVRTDDPMVGRVLVEGSVLTRQLRQERSTSAAWAGLAGLAVGVATLFALFALISVVVAGSSSSGRSDDADRERVGRLEMPAPPRERGEDARQMAPPESPPADVAEEAPTPRPPPPVPTGRVVTTGDPAAVWLDGAAGTLRPGRVPAGAYKVRARFGDEEVATGSIEVPAGGTVVLRCRRRFKQCK